MLRTARTVSRVGLLCVQRVRAQMTMRQLEGSDAQVLEPTTNSHSSLRQDFDYSGEYTKGTEGKH